MDTPTQRTAEYHAGPPVGTEPRPVRVALVGGSGQVVADDLHRLLRRRLLVLSSFLAATFAIWTAFSFAQGPDPDVPQIRTYRDLLAHHLKSAALVAANLAAAAVLWRRPPRTLFGLRVVEVAVVGPLVAVILSLGVSPLAYQFLEAAPREPPHVGQAFVGRYVNAGGLLWFFVLTAYGTLIPNTLRRAAVVLGLIAASPVALFAVYANWVRPLDPAVTAPVLTTLAVSNGVAVALVLIATSRVEVLRRQASEARRLGQYVLRERLGAGGMGEVYRAEHALLRRPCALKVIHPDRAGDPATLRRFEREVQATAALTHPNTVQVYDYGRTDDGTFYYVMEYLPGLTLEELVRRHGPLPPGRAVHFLRQVCAALGEAHARGLTHRDVKPGNVMVCERGGAHDVAKLLDFGLVRAPKDDPDGGTLTRDGAVAGTPAYMSPEQAGGLPVVDARSDIYSVGALAYFLLTGRPPFAGRPAVQVLAAHLYEPPAALPADVPGDLAAVVTRCLAKSPTERWPDAASLEAALARASVVAWTADDARAWWERASRPAREPGAAMATATWAEPGEASNRRGR